MSDDQAALFGTDPHILHRAEGPETSVEAAYSVDTTHLEHLVLKTIATYGYGGCISDQVRGSHPRLPYSSVTARFKALLDKELIEDSGLRRPGRSGRSQRVLRVTLDGLDAL